MDLLTLKLILTPTLVIAATLAERRWGAHTGGWISGLPLTSGPVSIFLATEPGPVFAADAASATILGPVALASFAVVYAWTSRCAGWALCIIAGLVAYVAAAAVLTTIDAPPVLSVLLACGSLLVALVIVPHSHAQPAAIPHASWDLPLRALVATTLVVAITGHAIVLGPAASGLLSPLPVFACVMTGFAHARGGRDRARTVLRGVLMGSFAFGVFFLVVAMLLRTHSIALAYLAATLGAVLAHGVSRVFAGEQRIRDHEPA